MVLLDGFTQLHLFHGLLDNEVYFYNEKSLAIKLHCQKDSLNAPEKRTPGACRTESAVFD